MQRCTHNYIQTGGSPSFSEYYTAAYNNAIFRPALREQIVFAKHNLVADGPFNEFHLILCRNVMIYFNLRLQDRVHQVLYDSLANFGMLGLGAKETLSFTPLESRYEALVASHLPLRRM